MTLTQFEDALHSVLVSASGLLGSSVCFAHLGGPVPTGLYARIERQAIKVGPPVEIVTDTPLTPAGAEITTTTTAACGVDVRVQVFGPGAFELAASVALELETSYCDDISDTLGISFESVRVSHVPALFDVEFQDRAAVSMTANFILERAHVNTYIQTIYGEGTVTDGGLPSVIPFGPLPSGD